MLRQALIALALAFTASTLYGCGGIQAAAKGGIFLHGQCSDKLQTALETIESTEEGECGGAKEKVTSGVHTLVKTKWVGSCIKNISTAEGAEMLEFNESTTDFPEQVDKWITHNTDAVKADYADKLKEACESADHASAHASNLSAQASAKVDEAKASASAKAGEAKAAASAKVDEAKSAASAKADEAKAAAGAKVDEAKSAASAKADEAKAAASAKLEAAKKHLNGDGDGDDEAESSDTRLFEVVRDADSDKGKSVSTSLALLAGAGMGLVVLGVVGSVRLARQRTSSDGVQLVDPETEIE